MSAVTDKDNGAKAMVERLRAFAQSKRTVRVGILSDAPKKEREGATGKLSLLEVAIIHEFGAPAANIPARSFIRATVDEHAADIAKLQRVLGAQVVAGKLTEEQALSALGAKVAGWVQARIAAGIDPALAPETVKRKKSSKPLIDTGQLRSAVTHVVEG